MPGTISIRIDQALYDEAQEAAFAEHRTVAAQIEFWAKLGRAALDNPDLPARVIAESLAALAEPHEAATLFVPRRRPRYKLSDLMAEMPQGLPRVEGWDDMPSVGLEYR